VSVVVKGLSEVQKVLDGYSPKALDKRMQKALMVGARTLVRPMRAEAPKRTGLLARSISARRGRRERPSAVVGPRGGKRGAFYRHFVIGGSRTGMRPNPFVDRAVRAHLPDAIAAYKRELFKED
jgi:hypothetical protein